MSQKKGSKYEEMELRRGPWTLEEDSLLIHYIARNGEGRWNLLARCSGLKRTGKSCRLRWLNYLKPDVKRGNLSPEEQFLILELHSKWGNRWSRIAQYLPGRTDNEIKNYWRTRVQKQARQLKIDANSTMFRDAVRCYYMPRLLEKMASNPSIDPNPAPVILSQPQLSTNPPEEFFNPSSTQYYEGSENCSPDFADLASSPPCALGSTSASTHFDPFTTGHGTYNAYLDASDLGPLSASAAGNSLQLDCTGDGNNWFDSLWSLDELWHVRKQHEWGSGIF